MKLQYVTIMFTLFRLHLPYCHMSTLSGHTFHIAIKGTVFYIEIVQQ